MNILIVVVTFPNQNKTTQKHLIERSTRHHGQRLTPSYLVQRKKLYDAFAWKTTQKKKETSKGVGGKWWRHSHVR